MRSEPLTAEAFAPFGQVVSCGARGREANQGTAQRFDFAAQVQNGRPHAKANLCAVKSQPRALPFEVKLLERHPHSSQAFLPMIASRVLVIVAPNALDGSPDLSKLRAFTAASGQGFSYAAGTWHHPLVVLDSPAELAMLVFEDGTAADCEEFALPSWLIIEG